MLSDVELPEAEYWLASADAETRAHALKSYKKGIDAAERLGCRWVRPIPGAGKSPDEDALRTLAEEKLAAYKTPREYVFLNALPRTPNGKVKRGELRRAHQRKSAQNSHAL